MAKRERHINYDLLAKYLADECNDDEKAQVLSLIDTDEEAKKIINQGNKLFRPLPESGKIEKVTFNTDKAWKNVLSQIDVPNDVKEEAGSNQRFLTLAWRVAAILVVGIGITLFFYLNQSKDLLYNVAQNEIKEFYLPDSTLVVLRNNSELIAEANYNQENRKVRLTGLAYFDVTKNPDKPFIIKMDGGTVEVLGTSFLINTKNESEIKVTVESGTVQFASSENPEIASIILEKNQTATLNLDDIKITKEEILSLNSFFWANKKLIYRQQPLPLVFNELEEIFQQTIEYDATIMEDCKLSAIFRDESFENIMNHISVSMDFTYELTEGKYLITSNGCAKN